MFAGWNAWSVYWMAWITVGFLVPEAIALGTNPKNTLSAQVWHLENMAPGIPWNFAHLMIAVFCVWMFFHFAFGLFR